jgi:hypothetical protein
MLVSAVDRRIHAVPLVVGFGLQRAQQAVPLPVLCPPVKPVEHRLPRPKVLRQVSPWHARPPPPQHCLDKSSVVFRWATGASLPIEKTPDLRPLSVVELRSNHPHDGTHFSPNGNAVPCAQHFPPTTEPGLGTGPRASTSRSSRSACRLCFRTRRMRLCRSDKSQWCSDRCQWIDRRAPSFRRHMCRRPQ